jgi:hypothetical protein
MVVQREEGQQEWVRQEEEGIQAVMWLIRVPRVLARIRSPRGFGVRREEKMMGGGVLC